MGCFNTLTSNPLPPSPPTVTTTATTSIAQAVGEGPARAESSRSSGGASSPPQTLDVTKAYRVSVQTSSYNEIWDRIHDPSLSEAPQVLDPDRNSVNGALDLSLPTKLTRLVSDYFDSSENTSSLCLLLQKSINQARSLYGPIEELIEHLPSSPSSITKHQCDWAFDTLAHFNTQQNPFPQDARFDQIRESFSQLKVQLDDRLRKAHSRVRLIRTSTGCSAICVVGSVVGAAVSAAVIVATHALAALVAVPFFTFLPTDFAKQQLHHISQLDAATRGTFVLHNDLKTIDRLVARLHATVESDKNLFGPWLEHGRDKYPILEVVNLLRRSHPNFLQQLKDLEEHVCLCLAAINRARSLLLQEIHLHQTRNSRQRSRCFGSG